MTIRERIQDELKRAMKAKDRARLEALRMAKGALLVKEKESADALTDDTAVAVLRMTHNPAIQEMVRGEIRKRRQSIEVFRELDKEEEAVATEAEIKVIEEFLPQQLSPEALEAKVRTYLEAHPEITHPGKLTGALKKELGDQADGKALNAVCRKVLEG